MWATDAPSLLLEELNRLPYQTAARPIALGTALAVRTAFAFDQAPLEVSTKDQAYSTTRSASSLALLGNRFSLIHKHAASLPQGSTISKVTALLRTFWAAQRHGAPFSANQPLWVLQAYSPSAPIAAANLVPNLWIAT